SPSRTAASPPSAAAVSAARSSNTLIAQPSRPPRPRQATSSGEPAHKTAYDHHRSQATRQPANPGPNTTPQSQAGERGERAGEFAASPASLRLFRDQRSRGAAQPAPTGQLREHDGLDQSCTAEEVLHVCLCTQELEASDPVTRKLLGGGPYHAVWAAEGYAGRGGGGPGAYGSGAGGGA